MQTVLIVIHLMIVIALVGVVLLQRSEGGGLGIGGGGGGGLMSARRAADALTRTTSILAAGFFATSIALGLLARYGESPTDILDRVPAQVEQNQDGESSGNGILDQLGGQDEAPASSSEAPAEPAAPAVPNN
jgi:preprotein translocase subunit SecG